VKNTHLFLDVFVVDVDTLALIHLSGLRCNDVTHVDLGTRSGCHSNVPEVEAGFSFFFNFFIYLITILLVSVVSLVSVVHASLRSQGFVEIFLQSVSSA